LSGDVPDIFQKIPDNEKKRKNKKNGKQKQKNTETTKQTQNTKNNSKHKRNTKHKTKTKTTKKQQTKRNKHIKTNGNNKTNTHGYKPHKQNNRKHRSEGFARTAYFSRVREGDGVRHREFPSLFFSPPPPPPPPGGPPRAPNSKFWNSIFLKLFRCLTIDVILTIKNQWILRECANSISFFDPWCHPD